MTPIEAFAVSPLTAKIITLQLISMVKTICISQ